jgi:hypothetical protein
MHASVVMASTFPGNGKRNLRVESNEAYIFVKYKIWCYARCQFVGTLLKDGRDQYWKHLVCFQKK